MKSKLAVQMYTVRDHITTAADLAESLAKISAIGYRAVQLSAVGAMEGDSPQVSALEARKMLDDNGIRCIATHRGFDSLAKDTAAEIEFHQQLGCDYVAVGSLPAYYREQGLPGYYNFVRDAEPVVTRLNEAGLRFGYHNHAFEFERAAGPNGTTQTLFDVFLDYATPALMMELDVYWIAHSGTNPQRIVERCRGRLPVIHLKDKEMVGNDAVMAPVGEGNLDWENLLPACAAANVEWYAVEQDTCRRDPFDCLKSSFEFLRKFEI